MGLFDNAYPNLPGSKFSFGELTLQNSTDTASVPTKSVLIFGMSKDGEPYVPYTITGMDGLSSDWGGILPDDNITLQERSIAKAARDVYAMGCNNIVVCKVNGIQASGNITGSSVNKISLLSIRAGEKYNDFTVVVNNTTKVMTFKDNNANTTATVTWTATTDLGSLIKSITKVAGYTGLYPYLAAGASTSEIVSLDSATFTMSGGDDELTLTDEEYSDRLISGYRMSEDAPGDYVVTPGAYLLVSGTDQESSDPVHFAQNLGQFCYKSTITGHARIGMISFEPLRTVPTSANVESRVSILEDIAHDTYVMNDYVPATTTLTYPLEVDNTQPYYGYLNVDGTYKTTNKHLCGPFVGPTIQSYNTFIGLNDTDGVNLIAGLKASLPFWQNITMQSLKNTFAIMPTYRYSLSQLNRLCGNQLNSFRVESSTPAVIRSTDGCMNAPSTDYYNRLSTADIYHQLDRDLSAAYQNYLGKPANSTNMLLVKSTTEDILKKYQTAGALNTYTLNVKTGGGIESNYIYVELVLGVPGEAKQIRCTMTPTVPSQLTLSSSG